MLYEVITVVNCLAFALVVANPILYTTLSNLCSIKVIRFAPVLPSLLAASLKYILNCFSETPYMNLAFCFSLSCKPYSEIFALLCPCCPGANGLFSNADFPLSLLSPFNPRSASNLLSIFSLGPLYLAIYYSLHSSSFRRSTTVVW